MQRKTSGLVDIKFLVLVLLAMPVFTAWHELGHIMAGKLLGFETQFFIIRSLAFYTKNSTCYPNCSFEEFLVNLGGPLFSLMVIFASFIGFLRTLNKKFLLGLALLAPFFYNFFWILANYFYTKKEGFTTSDESKIARYLNVPPLFVSGVFILGGLVILLVCYRKISSKERLSLVSASILGVLIYHIFFRLVLSAHFLSNTDILWKIY